MESLLKKLCRLTAVTLPPGEQQCRGGDHHAVLAAYRHLPWPMKLGLQFGLLEFQGLLLGCMCRSDVDRAAAILAQLRWLPGGKALLSFVTNLLLLEEFSPQATGTASACDSPQRQLNSGESLAIAVIGSGPGGLLAATLLAEAGREVTLIEAAPPCNLSPDHAFSVHEMNSRYRNQGVGVALGRVPMAFIEPFCLGGGSEINSGLYHRPPAHVIADWRTRYHLENLSCEALTDCCGVNEADLGVAPVPQPPLSSTLLGRAGEGLNWPVLQVPTWGTPAGESPPGGTSRQGFRTTKTQFLPRFLAAGGRLVNNLEIRTISRDGSRWLLTGQAPGQRQSFFARQVVLAAGSIQTPGVLRRSGLGRRVGRRLMAHPVIKLVAHFSQPVNQPERGIAVHQLQPPVPGVLLGGGISAMPHLALGLSRYPHPLADLAGNWRHYAVYTVMLHAEAVGRILMAPGCADPLAWYALTPRDWQRLADGTNFLAQALFAAGADSLYPCMDTARQWRPAQWTAMTGSELKKSSPALFSPHLTSTCPMGGTAADGVVDCWGRVWGHTDLWVADGSLLPTSPGVNPQGTIQALVRYNMETALQRTLI